MTVINIRKPIAPLLAVAGLLACVSLMDNRPALNRESEMMLSSMETRRDENSSVNKMQTENRRNTAAALNRGDQKQLKRLISLVMLMPFASDANIKNK